MASPKKQKVKKKVYRTPWGELLKYVFKHEVNICDHCGSKLVLIATITSRYSCQKILIHLGLPFDEVKVTAPRGPPELEYFDQSVDYN